MKKILNYIKSIKKENWIKNSFLIPILSVVVISIAHVITWYDLGNPIAWAVYLSVAIEIFALASVSAASIKVKKSSIWFLFGIVTTIQIIGNVFFIYQYIDIDSTTFLSWVELIAPWFEDWSLIDHKRLLSMIQGGTLPFMSLIALHFYIKFNENQQEDGLTEPEKIENTGELVNDEVVTEETVLDSDLKKALKDDQESESEENINNIVKSIKKEKGSEAVKTDDTKKNIGNDDGRHPQIMPGVN